MSPRPVSAGRARPGIGVLAVVAAMVAVAATIAVAVPSFPASSATVCGSCHGMRPFAAGLGETAHRGLACGRCHASDAPAMASLLGREAGMMPSFLLTFGRAEVGGPVSRVDDSGCTGCHRDIQDGTVSRDGLRIRHSTCVPKGASCVDCHGGVSHAKAERAVQGATMDVCLGCHDGTSASATCDLCHAAKLPKDRLTRGPWAVTHGADWERTHGLGDLKTCRTCHPATYCRRCHAVDLPHDEAFPRTHGKTALKARAQCLKCHSEKSFCTPCHGMAMPHPADFLPKHSEIAKGYDDKSCARCHPASACEACHAAHTHPGRTDGYLGTFSLPAVKR